MRHHGVHKSHQQRGTDMAIKINSKFITIDGKRAGVTYAVGPWVGDIDPTTIKIRPKQYSFPAEFRAAFAVENNSDGMTDYFEKDCIRVTYGHPLYDQIKAIAA
jgi:hypothetical protein